jgi:hypothetical protein
LLSVFTRVKNIDGEEQGSAWLAGWTSEGWKIGQWEGSKWYWQLPLSPIPLKQLYMRGIRVDSDDEFWKPMFFNRQKHYPKVKTVYRVSHEFSPVFFRCNG